jgi:hypothetical protein
LDAKIASFANDPHCDVRLSVVYVVGTRHPEVALGMLEDPDDETRYAAAMML